MKTAGLWPLVVELLLLLFVWRAHGWQSCALIYRMLGNLWLKFCSRSLTARISLLAPLILCGEGSPMALLLRLSDLFFATAAPDFSL